MVEDFFPVHDMLCRQVLRESGAANHCVLCLCVLDLVLEIDYVPRSVQHAPASLWADIRQLILLLCPRPLADLALACSSDCALPPRNCSLSIPSTGSYARTAEYVEHKDKYCNGPNEVSAQMVGTGTSVSDC